MLSHDDMQMMLDFNLSKMNVTFEERFKSKLCERNITNTLLNIDSLLDKINETNDEIIKQQYFKYVAIQRKTLIDLEYYQFSSPLNSNLKQEAVINGETVQDCII